MDEVLRLSENLLSDGDTVGHFTITEDVELLHRDFQGVTNELERLQKFLSKGMIHYILYFLKLILHQSIQQHVITKVSSCYQWRSTSKARGRR